MNYFLIICQLDLKIQFWRTNVEPKSRISYDDSANVDIVRHYVKVKSKAVVLDSNVHVQTPNQRA